MSAVTNGQIKLKMVKLLLELQLLVQNPLKMFSILWVELRKKDKIFLKCTLKLMETLRQESKRPVIITIQ